jgi:hypothetical protein
MAMHAGTLFLAPPMIRYIVCFSLSSMLCAWGPSTPFKYLGLPPGFRQKNLSQQSREAMSFHNNFALSHLPFLPAEAESVAMDPSDSTLDFEVVNSAAGMGSSQTLSHKHFPPWEAVSLNTYEQTPSSFKKPRSDVHVDR